MKIIMLTFFFYTSILAVNAQTIEIRESKQDTAATLTNENWESKVQVFEQLIASETANGRTNTSHINYYKYALGQAYFALGFYSRSLKALNYVLDSVKVDNTIGQTDSILAECFLLRAMVYSDLENFPQAVDDCYKADHIFSSSYGSNYEKKPLLLITLAQIRQGMQMIDSYGEILKEASALLESRLDTTSADYYQTLKGLTRYYGYHLGDFDKGRSYGQRTIELCKNLYGESNLEYALSMDRLADIEMYSGDFEKADELYLKALDITGNPITKHSYEYLEIKQDYALLLYFRNRFQEAARIYREVFDELTMSKYHGKGLYLNCASNLAGLYATIGNFDEAQKWFKIWNDAEKERVEDLFSFLAEDNQLQYLRNFANVFSATQSSGFSNGFESEYFRIQGYNNCLFSKGLILSNSRSLNRLLDAEDPQIIAKYKEWLAKKTELLNLQNMHDSDSRLRDSLREMITILESQLLGESQKFRSVKNRITWRDVQQSLEEGETAIEFSTFDYYNNGWTDSTLYVAYIVDSKSDAPIAVTLFEESQLDSILIGSEIQNLYASRGASIPKKRSSSSLYDLIIRPLMPYLKNQSKIYYSLDGKLHQVSLAAISDPDYNCLIDNFTLVTMSTTANLVIDLKEPEYYPAILIGDIDYDYGASIKTSGSDIFSEYEHDKSSQKVGMRTENMGLWGALPGTKLEIELISDLYEDFSLPVKVVSGSTASEGYIRSLSAKSPKVLHLATHGFFYDNDTPILDFYGLESQPMLTRQDNALVRSGLVFSGANTCLGGNQDQINLEEDGILTSYEISMLDLSETDLVVLSACETGLGAVESNIGVYGLQRAFMMAGVDHIIMSLWEIPDFETSEFMSLFYRYWIDYDDIVIAFNQTQQSLRQKFPKEPYKWAGFVLLK